MALTQGSPLPNITTTQQQSTAAPSWYSDFLSGISNQATMGGQNAQFVGAQPLQQQAFQLAGQNIGNYQPTLEAATNLAQNVGNTNTASTIGQYMSPYTQQVVGALGDVGLRNIRQTLAPQATSGLVGSGQFGSKRGAEALGQTIRDALQNLNLAQSQALQTGYGQALGAAQQEQNKNLLAAQQLGSLAGQTQTYGLGDVNALATLGAQQQQIGQAEQLFPLQTALAQAGALRGYTVPTTVSSTYTGPIPGAYSASPLQQISGIGALLGALNQTPAGGGATPMQNIGSSILGVGNWLNTNLNNLFGGSQTPEAPTSPPLDNSFDYSNYYG